MAEGKLCARDNLKVFPDILACLKSLKSGAVRAVVFDAPVLKYDINKLGPDDFVLVGNPFERNIYGFGLRRESTLRKQIKAALLNMNENGVTDESLI